MGTSVYGTVGSRPDRTKVKPSTILIGPTIITYADLTHS